MTTRTIPIYKKSLKFDLSLFRKGVGCTYDSPLKIKPEKSFRSRSAGASAATAPSSYTYDSYKVSSI